jgi:cell division protein FtsB
MRLVTVALCLLLAGVWFGLLFGRGSLYEVRGLEQKWESKIAANKLAQARNAQVQAELADLREGLELVEEKARFEMGMVGPHEILVQYGRRR